MNITDKITQEFNLQKWQTENTINMIDEGNTIPFISRYRKERTGSLDDQVLRELNERLEYLRNLDCQRKKIIDSITDQDKMTDLLLSQIENAETITELDDIYRPFRPKRKTRASIAKSKGLEPLAEYIYAQSATSKSPEDIAVQYLNPETEVNSIEDAIQGASDIIAEKISDDSEIRKRIRYVCMMKGLLISKGATDDIGVYEIYNDFNQQLTKIAGYRILAINRGEKEGLLKVNIQFDIQNALKIIYSEHVKEGSPCTETVKKSAEDAYNRLIFPSIEREIRNELTDKASTSAIQVFSVNLKQLLMQPPVKGRITLGLDPGYRTGCKVAVVDETGKVLDTGVIYAVPPHNKKEEAKKIIINMINKYNVSLIAIGNGTASHETEVFASEIIHELNNGIEYMVVSESGASVYSASKLAAQEFPEYDVSLRSAVSIARRLQDPLAELVKIDPKAIGVGQYQHDMPQAQLTDALNGVVEDCVNKVGVDLNTASSQLLSNVAGISSSLAKNIVSYREENGQFNSRTELKKVSKLGPKAYEQCAGFLRIPESNNILDNTGVHPESYNVAKSLLKLCNINPADLNKGSGDIIQSCISEKGISNIADSLNTGIPTLNDIIQELSKPGRDPRDELPSPMLRTDILGMEDLKAGMELKGTVRNVIDFGAFVDIGVHQDGLVHISQISYKHIEHPSQVLKVGDIITVWVLAVDIDKKRISLTMKDPGLQQK